MKRISTLLVAIILFSCKENIAQTKKLENQPKPVISILGMTHLHNPGADEVNLDIGNIHSDQRQKELKDLIGKLSEFKPTKIAIEIPWNDSLFSHRYYQLFLRDSLNEEKMGNDHRFFSSEIVQIAYPLAKKMEHNQLYTIDAFTTFPINSAMAFAQSNRMDTVLKDFQDFTEKAQKEITEVSQKSIPEIMTFINSEYFAKNLNQNFYLKHLTKIGNDSTYIGTDVVAEWYSRNLRIFTNLSRITEEDDRVLVIFGAGHKDILEDLIKDRVDWEYYDINQILKE